MTTTHLLSTALPSTLESDARPRVDAAGAAALAPLYHQIKEHITRHVVSGQWRSDHKLPSEPDLCAHFGVSHGTLSRVLGDLENQSLIVRRHGHGTFVAKPKFEGSVLGSYRNFRVGALPYDARSRLLQVVRLRATPDLQRLLQLGKRDSVYDVRRIQDMDGVAITLSTSYVPAALVPGLEKLDLEHEHFYGLLEQRYGLTFLRADEFIEPVLADELVARHLERGPTGRTCLLGRAAQLPGRRQARRIQASLHARRPLPLSNRNAMKCH